MNLLWPSMFVMLLALPALVILYWRLLKRRELARAELGSLGIVQDRTGRSLGRRRHYPFILFLIGLALLLFSLSRPEMPVSLPRVEGTVILAFDVSSSMAAEDLEPSRIEAAKAAARTFVEEQPSTVQVGVVAFGNGGIIVQQPTDLTGDVLATIDRLSASGGTSLSQGIFTSINAIAGENLSLSEEDFADGAPPPQIGSYNSAVIVLLSDGEDTSQADPLQIAQIAAEAGIRVYPIGIGSPDGAVLELDGFNVVTQLNEQSLQEIAALTNGDYFHAADAAALEEIYQNIDLQLTIAGEMIEVTAIFAGLGLLFLLLGGSLTMLWFGRVP